jgi:hypothetical protein
LLISQRFVQRRGFYLATSSSTKRKFPRPIRENPGAPFSLRFMIADVEPPQESRHAATSRGGDNCSSAREP